MLVYRGYDQAQLDAQYDNGVAVPDRARWTDRWPVASLEARARLGGKLDAAYGSHEREKLDIFPAAGDKAPILMFIHGGYWRMRSKDEFSFIAPSYVAAGISVVMVGYPLAPAATMDDITESARQAVIRVYRNAASFGGDPARLHISGYSSGGHLVGMMMATDWAARGLSGNAVKGGCAISGIYDLEPFRLCSLNAHVGVTKEAAARNSPMHLVPKKAIPLILTVGGKETDEFRRQTEAYADVWRRAGLPLEIVPMPEDHHYSIMDGFADPISPLFQAVIRQIFGG